MPQGISNKGVKGALHPSRDFIQHVRAWFKADSIPTGMLTIIPGEDGKHRYVDVRTLSSKEVPDLVKYFLDMPDRRVGIEVHELDPETVRIYRIY